MKDDWRLLRIFFYFEGFKAFTLWTNEEHLNKRFTSFNLKCILIHLYVSEYICWLSKYSWYIVLCRRLCLLNSYQTLIKNEAYQKYILYSLHLRNIMELFEEARVILVVQVHVYCLVITLHHTEATGKTRFTKCIVV